MQYLFLIFAYVGRGTGMNDPNKEGVEALGSFFNQFGSLDDVYTRVFWEVLLEELYGINSSSEEEENAETEEE
jgi:hypothetical protein